MKYVRIKDSSQGQLVNPSQFTWFVHQSCLSACLLACLVFLFWSTLFSYIEVRYQVILWVSILFKESFSR